MFAETKVKLFYNKRNVRLNHYFNVVWPGKAESKTNNDDGDEDVEDAEREGLTDETSV